MGGPIEIHFLPGQASYTGSERNGVRSQNWGPWQRSFTITRPGEQPQLDANGRLIADQATLTNDAPSPHMTRMRTAPASLANDEASSDTLQGTVVQAPMDEAARRRTRRQESTDARRQPSRSPGETRNQLSDFASPTSLSWQEELPGQIPCEMRGQELSGDAGTRHTVYCPAGCGSASIWGTDLYADDSSICTAAIHAGVIQSGEGGLVSVIIGGEAKDFAGSSRFGITSARWRAWPRSFTVRRPGSD